MISVEKDELGKIHIHFNEELNVEVYKTLNPGELFKEDYTVEWSIELDKETGHMLNRLLNCLLDNDCE